MTVDSEKLVRDFYEAIVPGQRARLSYLLSTHAVYELPEGMPTGGGRFQGMMDILERFLPDLYGALDARFIAEEFISAGEQVVAIGRIQGKTRQGAVPIDVPFVHVWTAFEGRLHRLRFFTDTAVLSQALRQGLGGAS